MTSVLAVLYSLFLLSAAITINNTGYEDFVVAIHKDVPQDNKIIDEIKDMFREGSIFLYESLDHKAYFRKVTILVPNTWTADQSWEADESLTFKDADVRVDRPHPLHGNDPYVFQPGQCGEQGRYIHFTPAFLLNTNGFRDFNYGNAGRVLVHEFAHYRYGVFDEYGFRGSKSHPLWYLDGLEARPTGCSRHITGLAFEGDEPCTTSNGLPTDDCIFIPDMNSDSIRASIMAYHYVHSVTKFCKTGSNSIEEEHNYWAPNQHNKMCTKTGTHDVIMNHADFRSVSPPVEGVNVTPTFDIVQVQEVTAGGQVKCGRRTVLVLDLSGSMERNSRYFKLGQAGDRFIRDILPIGTDFGIVIFTDSSSVWTAMTMITDDSVRDTVASGLPVLDDFGGGTSISTGLSTALELLERNDQRTKDANIVLITDGITSEDLLAVSLPNLIAAEVKVHSIGLGPNAEGTIGQLSSETGGSFSYYSESSTSTDLDSAMERLLQFVATCENVGGIEIERLGLLVDLTSPLTGTIQVDDSVGNNTLFSFSFPQGALITVTMTDPDSQEYDSTSSEYSYTSSLNIVRFRFPFAQDGGWDYTIQTTASTPQLVVVVAKSSVRANVTDPIETETRLNTAGLDLSNSESAPVVYTYVHRGYEPLVRAEVTVTVDRSPDPNVVIYPKDDGILPDNRENDGVYTAFFTDFTGNQRISMQTRVQNIPGQTAFFVAGGGGSSGASSIYQNTTVKPKLELTGNFTRTSSPGAVDVSGFTDGADLFPPGTVTDFRVVTFDKTASTVTMTWTSPGDDYTEGTVDRYELRMGWEFLSLMSDFNNSRLITELDLKEGNFTPTPAGSPKTVVIGVPTDWPHDAFVFGLKAFDEVNKTSLLSNLPSVTFKEVIIPVVSRRPNEVTETVLSELPNGTFKDVILPEDPPPTPETQGLLISAIIGGVIGGIILLIIVITLIVIYIHRRKCDQYRTEA